MNIIRIDVEREIQYDRFSFFTNIFFFLDFGHNMVLLELMFTNVLDNNCRAYVYDALLVPG